MCATQPYWILLILWRVWEEAYGGKAYSPIKFRAWQYVSTPENTIREMLLAVGMLIENAANKRIIGKNLWSIKWTNSIEMAELYYTLYKEYFEHTMDHHSHSKSIFSFSHFLRSKFIHRFDCLNDALRTQPATHTRATRTHSHSTNSTT